MHFALTNHTPLMHSLCALLLLCAAETLRAETDGHTLLKFQREAETFNAQQFQRDAEALNAQQPDAHRYRAGFFYGYINGVLDSLNNRSVCFSECRCELETLINKHYRQHPKDLDKPAGPTLTKLFEQHYPCKRP